MKNMKKVLAVLLATLMMISAIPFSFAASAAAGDVALDKNFDDGTNGGFERAVNEDGYIVFDATTADWQNTYIYANDIKANTDYVVTFKAKANKEANLTFKVNNNWGGDTVKESVAVTTEWADYELKINSGDVTTAIVMFASDYEAAAAAVYSIDDVKIVETVDPAMIGKVVNGDFSDNSGWALGSGATIADGVLKLENIGAWSEAAMQTVPVKPNTNYEITWKSQRITGAGAFNMIVMNAAFANLQVISGQNWMTSTSTEWINHSVTVNTGDSAVMIFKLTTETNSNKTILLDDIKISEVKEPSDDGFIKNGDFETGKILPWDNLWGSNTVEMVAGHSGDYAMKITAGGAWTHVRQTGIAVKPNTDYVIKLYAKDAANYSLLIKDSADSGNVAQAGLNAGSEWTPVTFEFNSGNNSAILFSFMSNNPGDTCTVDDVTMYEKVAASNDGYLVNGTFETGDLAPWDNLWGSCPKAEVVAGGKDDNFALDLVSGEWKHLRQTNIAVEANTEYKITAWAKNAKDMSLLIKDGSDSKDIVNAGVSAGDEWTEFTATFNSGDYTTIIFSLMGCSADAYGTFDNIVMEKIETPVAPPVEGSKENPYQVPKPNMLPSEVELTPGAAVYYQFPALKFTNWTLSAMSVTAVEVDGVMHEELSLIDRCIKVTLSMDGNLVGFHNNTDEAIIATLILEEPVGTMDAPFQMQDGANEITLLDGNPYYSSYLPASTGDYVLNASDYENFEIYLDLDQDINTEEDRVQLTAETTYTLESYLPIFIIAIPTSNVSDIVLTVTPPAKGTENNPYYLSGYDEIALGLNGEGDGLWPTSAEGTHYVIFAAGIGSTLVVEGNANLVITRTVEEVDTTVEYALDGRMEIAGAETIKIVASSADAASIKMSVLFPEGTEENPKAMNVGANVLPLDDMGNMYYATFTADKDGVLIINPNTLTGLGYTDASNLTSGDSDYIFAGFEGEGASEDNVLTIPVSAGDQVLISSVSILEDDDFNIVAWDLTLYVCYEADHAIGKATCTEAAKCATCGMTEGKALGHKSDKGTVTKKATCTATGTKTYKCTVCRKTLKTEPIAKLGHDYEKKVTKATLTKDGVIKNVCERCDYVASKTTTIYKASKISLSKTSYTYNGKVQKPSVIVKDSKGNTISSSNYTVTYASGLKNAGTYKVTVKMKGNYSDTKTLSYTIKGIDVSKCKISLSKTSYTYTGKVQKPSVTVKNASGTKLTTSSYTVTYASGRKNVGTYKVTIKMKGNYTGTKTLTFKINPVKTSISKLTAGTKKLTVKWAKKSTQVTGYEIQYSTSKTFKSVKTKTVSSYKTTSATLSSLKAKTTYYVRVRTYKTVNGVKYYSGWTTVKYLKTK